MPAPITPLIRHEEDTQVEVVIGIQHSGRELRLDLADDGTDVRAAVEEALDQDRTMLWITDKQGRQVGVPVAKLAYVEIDPQRAGKKVGFAVGADN